MKKHLVSLLWLGVIPLFLHSCATPPPEYEDTTALAKHTLQLERTKDIQERASLLNASLEKSRSFYQLPPYTTVQDKRIPLLLDKNLKPLGLITTSYSYYDDNPRKEKNYYAVILNKITLKDRRRHFHFLWDDLEFNSVLIHELAHAYFMQRYPYISRDENTATKAKSYKICEGYSVWTEVRWVYSHYTYPRRFFLESIWEDGQDAFDYFDDEFYDDDSGLIDWAKLDAYERSLAPAGHVVKPLEVRYP